MKSKQTGFTLIELMIVIVVLSILAVLAYPSYQTYIRKVHIENARASMQDVLNLMERQYAQRATFCAAGSAAGSCTAPDISSVANDRYTLVLDSVNASDYVLTARPQNGMYSANVLANNRLNIIYDSVSATFALCNTQGLADSLAGNDIGADDCEVK